MNIVQTAFRWQLLLILVLLIKYAKVKQSTGHVISSTEMWYGGLLFIIRAQLLLTYFLM